MQNSPDDRKPPNDPPEDSAGSGSEAQDTPVGGQAPGPSIRIIEFINTATGRLAAATGHLAAAALLVLAATIILGIILRVLRIDNYWTYDLDLFSLVWLAFVGAVLTSLREHHVTAGIALENMLGGRGTVLNILRFAVVTAFLVIFAVSGYRQAYTSFVTHETTIDVVAWPVWIAKAALPLGAVLWLAAEIHKFLRRVTQRNRTNR